MSRTTRSLTAAAIAGGLLLTTLSTAASSTSEVVRGELAEFAVGAAEGQDISGHAELVRRADGTTFVLLHAEGLKAGGSYAAHVHAKACGDGDAGGHYMHDHSGPVDAVNEIWPGGSGFTATDGGTATVRATNGFTAGADAVSVVIHEVRPGGKPKVACADLG